MENNFIYFIPDIFIAIGILFSIICFFCFKNKKPKFYFNILLTTLFLAALGYIPYIDGFLKLTGIENFINLPPFEDYNRAFLNHSIVFNSLNIFFKFLITSSAFIVSIMSFVFIKKLNQKASSFVTLFLLSTLGANFAAISNDFLSLFISLEIFSLSLFYIIAIFNNVDGKNCIEAGIKYYIANIIALCLVLFGAGLIYLHTGSINFSDLNTLATNGKLPATALFNIAGILILMGFMEKICAFPFQIWFLDIFKGINYSTGLFISSVGQITGAIAIYKILSTIGYIDSVLNFAAVLCAVLNILIWAFLLFRIVSKQWSIKYFLASNSILNTGFVLLAFSFLTKNTFCAGIFYLVVCTIINFGIWASFMLIIKNIKKNNEEYNPENLNIIKGISYISPFFALTITLCLLCSVGMPFMAGFSAKFYLFTEISKIGLKAAYPLLFVILASILAFYCNIKLISTIFSRPEYKFIKKGGIYKKPSLFRKLNIYTLIASFSVILLFLGFFLGGYVINVIEKII